MSLPEKRSAWDRVMRCCVLLVALAAPGAPGGEWWDGELKAAYIYNFAKFIDWPSPSLGPAAAAFDLGVVGSEEAARELARRLSSHTVRGHPIAVRHLLRAEDGRGCPIVYIALAGRDPIAAATAALSGQPVLTIGEGMEFVEAGGMIALYLEGDRLRFAIRPAMMERSQLRASAKLLALARIVEDNP